MPSLTRFIPKKPIVRWFLAAAIVFIAGLLGLSAVFSDLGPGETMASRILFGAGVLLGGGLLIGLLLGKRWYLAVAASWGTALYAALMLLLRMRGAGRGPGWSELVVLLVVPSAATLLGGFLGSRINRNTDSFEQRAT